MLPEWPMPKISVSLTEEHARVVEDAVASGDYGSSSEVIREALRDWRTKRTLGRLWDEGLASGPADPDETIEDMRRVARLVRSERFAAEARRQSALVAASPHEADDQAFVDAIAAEPEQP